MSTKKCKKCGWEYPREHWELLCKFCREPFTEGCCRACGEWTEDFRSGLCPKCFRTNYHKPNPKSQKRNVPAYKKLKRIVNKQYEDWIKWIGTIKEPYKTLTQDEWLKVCAHFNKCPICGEDEITTRKLFIPFKYGGRYCKWNVIPACDKCAHRTFNKVLFISFYKKFNGSRDDLTKERLKAIMDYLKSTLKEEDYK